LRHDGVVNRALFSPDGKRVVTASGDKTARVWDAATGAPIGRALQHDGLVWSASFSPDGVRVVTASGDKTARVWDAATGAPIGKPLQHEGSVNSASFSPDGARVVTASADKTARVWTGPPLAPNIVATACKMLGDHDTANLSTRYGIDVNDPICTGEEPAPDTSYRIDR
jgi:WD40 repeat protein